MRALLNCTFTAIAILLCGLGTGIITARLLGPEDRGLLGVVVFWPQFLMSLATLSLADSLVVGLRKLGNKAAVAAEGKAIAVWLFILGLPVGTVIIWLADRGHGAPIVVMAIVVWSIQLLYGCVDQVAQGISRSEQNYSMVNWLRLSFPAACLAILIFPIAFGGGLREIVSAYGAALVVGAGLRWWLIAKCNYGHTALSSPEPRTLLRTAVAFHSVTLVGILAAHIDRLTIVQSASPETIGLYFVALTAAGTVHSLVNAAISSFALPTLVGVEYGQRPALALRLLRLTWAFSLLGSAAMALAAPAVIPIIFGANFTTAGPLTSIIAAVIATASIRQALVEILKSVGEARGAMVGGIVYLAVFALTWSTAWHLNASWPVVWALGASNAASTAYLALAVRRRVPEVRLRDWLLPTPGTARELVMLTLSGLRKGGLT